MSCASSTWSLPSRARRALREDVEDQLRAVDDAQIEPLRDVARLARRELAVEDHEVDVELEAADHELLQLPGADQRARIDLRAVLRDDVDDGDAGRARELAELVDRVLEVVAPPPAGDRDEDRALVRADLVHGRRARELLLERPDPRLEVEIELRRRHRRELLDAAAFAIRGQQRRGVRAAGQPLLVGGDAHHRVEPELREVGEVVRREAFVREVRVDAAHAAQAAAAGAHAPPVRQLDAAVVADHHVRHRARAVDQHADLAADLARELGEPPGEVVGQEAIGRKAALREALELLDVVSLQAVGIAEDADFFWLLAGGLGGKAARGAAGSPKA